MRTRVLFCLGALLLDAVPVRAAPKADEAAIDGVVKEALREWGVPGVAVAVVRDGKVIYLKGHGVRTSGKKDPVTPDTLFPLASGTKGFTTTALAMLVDEGKVGWDDPVRKHLDFFKLSDPLADRDVTVRDLLCHRTGLGDHPWLWYRAPWSVEEAVRRAGKVPLDCPFRTAYQYQNTMVAATGLVLEKASGKPWERFVKERVLDPLGLDGVRLTGPAAREVADHASPHRRGSRGNVEVIPFYPFDQPDAALSAHAGARDLAHWLLFHLGDGTHDGKRLVSKKNLDETHTPQQVIPVADELRAIHSETAQMSYALGWVVQDYRGRQLVSHGGMIDGFRVHLTLAPRDGLGIALLNNLDQSRMNQALTFSLLDLLFKLPPKNWNALHLRQLLKEQAAEARAIKERLAARRADTRPSRELAAYVGAYENAAYGTARVSLDKGTLVWAWGNFRGPLEHFEDDAFVLREGRMRDPNVTFKLNGKGDVTEMRVGEIAFGRKQ